MNYPQNECNGTQRMHGGYITELKRSHKTFGWPRTSDAYSHKANTKQRTFIKYVFVMNYNFYAPPSHNIKAQLFNGYSTVGLFLFLSKEKR